MTINRYRLCFLLIVIIVTISLCLEFKFRSMQFIRDYWAPALLSRWSSALLNITSDRSSALTNMISRRSTALDVTSDGCTCVDNTTGETFNFCYQLPWNKTIYGRQFSCEWLPILRELDLLGNSGRYVTNPSRLFSSPNSIVFISASSQDHFAEELALIRNVQDRFPPLQRLIFYDLGLDSGSATTIRMLCNVEYRRFPFEKYPDWVKSLYEFRWKALVIAEALKEFDAIWYMDSSVRFKTSNLSLVYALFSCGANGNLNSRRFATSTILSTRENCGKSSYLLHGGTGHGIFPVTHPNIYEYIPTDLEKLKNRNCSMHDAGFVFAIRTRQVIEKVLKWYVLCSLERACMGPPATSAQCSFNAVDRYGLYAKCHRFDQSVVNLLLANLNHFHSWYWTSGVEGFYEIRRQQGLRSSEKTKLKICQMPLGTS